MVGWLAQAYGPRAGLVLGAVAALGTGAAAAWWLRARMRSRTIERDDERQRRTTFHSYAEDYDAARRRLVPMFDTFYGTAVAALQLASGPVARVLDLGAGTGLLSERVLAAHPDAELVLLDGAPAMLDQARARLGDRARYVVGDLTDPLPAGPWDAVVSALAIHHLPDADKARLFTRVREALRAGRCLRQRRAGRGRRRP